MIGFSLPLQALRARRIPPCAASRLFSKLTITCRALSRPASTGRDIFPKAIPAALDSDPKR
jgi:hypothetical protein